MLRNSHWFNSLQSQAEAKLNIFFFPHAGGGTLTFRTWQKYLPSSVGCYFTQLPGREQRIGELPFHRLKPLIQELGKAILPYLDTPFVFFGHSMGALISFELARELRRNNLPLPLHLFVAACAAPQIQDWHPQIHTLSDSDFLKEISTYAGLPNEILSDREAMQTILPASRADFTLCETYHYLPEAALACPISAFGGIVDSYVAFEDIAAWRVQTSASFIMRMFPGNHFFLHEAKEQIVQLIDEDRAIFVI